MRLLRTISRIWEGEAPAEPYSQGLRLGGSLALPGMFALLLTCGGCWEEIHYVPKPAGVQMAGDSAEPPAEESPTAIAESTVAKPTVPEPAMAAPAAVDPLVAEAEAPPSPGADDLFSPEGSADIAVESPADAGDESAKAASIDGSILPTPDGSAADLKQAGPEESSREVGGRRGDLAATGEERRLVWEAASKWSLAAAYHAKGRDAPRKANLDGATAAAAKLDVELPPLPTAATAGNLQATVVEALRGESAVALTNALAKRFGPAEAALADLAIRSHLLLLTYSPRSGDAVLQAEALRRTAEASGLPAETWMALATLLDERAPFVAVRQAVFEQNNRIEKHLEQ